MLPKQPDERIISIQVLRGVGCSGLSLLALQNTRLYRESSLDQETTPDGTTLRHHQDYPRAKAWSA